MWDKYFMTLAFVTSLKSKDPSTKVGAIIVKDGTEIVSTGYNGLPRGFDDKDERYLSKSYKYATISHAEENAIMNAVRRGASTKGSSMYVLWMPCSTCARMVIQSGISEVIFYDDFPGAREKKHMWLESMEISRTMLMEAGVKIRSYSGPLIKMEGLYSGKKWLPNFDES